MARLATLRIRLLGGFGVERDGRPIADAAWRRNRARALVKLLALTPGHRLHREQVLDTLWPDLDPQAAGANLRKAIHFARAALGPEMVVASTGHVSLDPSVEVDAERFVRALDEGRTEEAVEAYAGELLPEDRFEAWTDEHRERLKARYASALGELASTQVRAGEPDAAIRTLERLVELDPLDETAHRRLMELYEARGDRHLALREFRRLERVLREALGVEPSDESRKLFESLASGDVRVRFAGEGRQAVGGRERASAAERRLITVVSAAGAGGDIDPAARIEHTLASWGATTIAEDGVVTAVFGLPSIGEDDAERAARAALEVANLREVGAATRFVRVGVATDETIVRASAAGRLLRPGDPVERMAGALRERAVPGVPLASPRTVRAAGPRLRFGEPAAEHDPASGVRGVPILGHDLERVVADEAGEAPLVGRRAELAGLLALVDDMAATGRPRLVVVSGAAGIGKSRLVREAVSAMPHRTPETRVLRGRSLPGGRGATYWALGELLRDAAGISLAHRPREIERRLRAAARTMLPDLSVEDRDATIAALAASAGIRLDANPLENAKPEDVRRALETAWPRFVSGLAAAAPTALVLEDLHWASAELLELIELIVARASGPLLVLVTTRPDLRDVEPGFGGGVDATTIALAPLTPVESGELIGHLAGTEALDEADRARILDRGEGNPFYLEQLTSHVRDTGREGLPETLLSLLGARLDALPALDRRVLQEASVVGRAFWAEPLEDALPGERIAARLGLLERRRFVLRRTASTLPGHDEWAFRHALLHDVAYRSVPRNRRARAHARAGNWLERIAGPRADEVADLLAHHFESALASSEAADVATRAKAIDYLARAGTAARRRFDLERALDLHGRALRLALDDGDRLRILEAVAEDHEAGFHGDSAAGAYREALAIARRARGGEGSSVPRLARKLAWLMAWNPGAFRTSPDPAAPEGLVSEGLGAEPVAVERGWLLLARGTIARLYRGSEPFGQGSRADSRPLAERIADVDAAIEIARAAGDEELEASAGHARGMLYGFEGRFRDMLELARQEVARLPADATSLERSDALRRLAVLLINIEADFETGVRLGRESRTLAGEINPHQLLHTLWPIMAGLFQLGRFDEVRDLAAEAASAFRIEPAIECQFVRDVPVIAGAALVALDERQEGASLAALPGDPMADAASASAWQARFATLAGRPETARQISIDKALERRTYGPQHAFAYLEALEALEDWPAIDAFAMEARAAAVGNRAIPPLLDRALGRGRAAEGDSRAARRLLRRAAAGFEQLGMIREAAIAQAALASLEVPSPGDAPSLAGSA